MIKKEESENLITNDNGKKPNQPKYERLPENYEVDDSETARALMKAVRMTRRRLYPELYQAKKKRA